MLSIRDAGAGRPAIEALLQALDDVLTGRAECELGETYEGWVRESLQARRVILRQVPSTTRGPGDEVVHQGATTRFRVPGALRGVEGVLEVEVAPGARLREDQIALTRETLTIAGLVLQASGQARPGQPGSGDGAAPLIGTAPAMQRLRSRVERVAETDFTVLIQGESGTGKELVARQIHELSARRRGPFVAVNCAALVETLLEAELFGIEERTATGVRGRRGKFEHANRGTLFLDEIADLSLSAQAKLLRAIQDLAVERVGGHATRRVDVRIVAATNQPLAELVSRGLFRGDLYYRLAGVEVPVPPLRERQGDIAELAAYFLARHRHQRALSLSPEALDALRLYAWPGNVRELERLMESVVALCTSHRIELDDLPGTVRRDYVRVLGPSVERRESMRAWGSRYARLVYERCNRNKRRTCDWLRISYHTLEAYLRYGQAGARDTPRQMPTWARESVPPASGERPMARDRSDS